MLFETNRILCRNFQYEDFEDIHSYASNDEVIKYTAWGPNSEEDTRIFMDESIECINDKPRLRFELAVIDKQLNKFVGAVAIFMISEDNKVGEIGYSIKPEYWNNGYAAESAKAVVKYGFEVIGLHRIQAACDVRNIGSANVLKKIGMKQEGRIREHILVRNRWRDSYLYSILDKEFRSE